MAPVDDEWVDLHGADEWHDAPAQSQQPSYAQRVGNAAHDAIDTSVVGPVKGVGSTLFHLGKLASQTPLVGPAAEDAANRLAELLGLGSAHSAENFRSEPAALEATNTAQKLGKGAEQIGEFFIPGAAEAGSLGPLAALLEKAGLAGRMATEGATAAGVAGAQGGNPTIAGVAGAAGPVVAKVGEVAAPRLVNSVIGARKPAFATGANPGQGVVDEGIVASSLGRLRDKIGSAQDAVGARIQSALSSPQANAVKVNVRGLINKRIDSAIDGLETIGADDAITRLEALRKGLDSKFTQLGSSADAATPAELFQVKKSLDKSIKHGGNDGIEASIKAVAKTIRRDIANGITSAYAPIKDLNSRYANLAEAWDAVTDKMARSQSSMSFLHDPLSWATGIVGGVTHHPVAAGAAIAGNAALRTAPGATIAAQGARALAGAPAPLIGGAAGVITHK